MSRVDALVCFSAIVLLLLAYWDTQLHHAREETGRERDRAERAVAANASLYARVDELSRELELGDRTDRMWARICADIERDTEARDADRAAGAVVLDDYRSLDDLGGAA